MDFGSLFIGSDISAVTQRCLEEMIVETPPAPEEVLIVGHNRGDHDRLTSIWDSQRPPIASTVTGLDDVITRWVEASEGPTEELDTITRRRLVEQALASVDREETALLDGDTKLVSPFSSLFTAFEEGGLTTTDALGTHYLKQRFHRTMLMYLKLRSGLSSIGRTNFSQLGSNHRLLTTRSQQRIQTHSHRRFRKYTRLFFRGFIRSQIFNGG